MCVQARKLCLSSQGPQAFIDKFAFIDVVSGVSRGYREATAGRLRGRRGMAPRKAKPVLMFTLVKAVKKPRLLDLDGPTQRAASRIAARLAALWS